MQRAPIIRDETHQLLLRTDAKPWILEEVKTLYHLQWPRLFMSCTRKSDDRIDECASLGDQ